MSLVDEEIAPRVGVRPGAGVCDGGRQVDWQAFEQAAENLRDALAAHAVQVRQLACDDGGARAAERVRDTVQSARCTCRWVHAADVAGTSTSTSPPAAWISVTDRLPAAEVDVLCRRQQGDVAWPPIVAGRFRGQWLAFGADATPVRHVTHWAPLPELALRD